VKMRRSPNSARIAGFLLIIAGILVFYFAASFIVSSGLIAVLIFAWSAACLAFAGVICLLRPDLRKSLISLPIIFVALFGWTLILLLPLPDDSQILLASIVSLSSVLLYASLRRAKTLNSHWSNEKDRWLSMIVGISLFVPGLILLILCIGLAVILSPFMAWLITLPLALDILIGLQLMRRKSLKEAAIGWLFYALPPAVVFMFGYTIFFIIPPYNILATIVTATAIISGLYLFHKWLKDHFPQMTRKALD